MTLDTRVRRRRRAARRPSWGVVALSVAVAATSIAVPPLILSWAQDSAPTASAPTASAPTPPTAAGSAPASPSGSASAPASPSGSATVSASAPPPTRTALPAATFRPVRIDAADPANRSSGVAVTDCPICASGRRVQYLGQGHWLIVTVRVPGAGRRTLTIVYETAGARTLQVAVNGDPPLSLTLPGAGSWTSPARVSVPVQLPAGATEIKFYNDAEAAPDLDQILVS